MTYSETFYVLGMALLCVSLSRWFCGNRPERPRRRPCSTEATR